MLRHKNIYSFVNRKPIILIAPLDWGLGHATRCIPIITHFLAIGCEVIVASNGYQQALLQHEFGNVRFVNLPGYRLTYAKNKFSTIAKILCQIPKMIRAIRYENKWLAAFLSKNQVDAVISDNRYGMYNHRVPSVFITHQLTVKTPFGRPGNHLLRSMLYRYINKFNECWVPDYSNNENFAGELSHPPSFPAIPVKYIGKLSRLSPLRGASMPDELMIILSGPEPQRSIFEALLLPQLAAYRKPVTLVRGLPEEDTLPYGNKNLVIYNHLPANRLNSIISRSDTIISRSGYSTVMDLTGFGKKCIFVPTPGQSEQEYLARYLHARQLCLYYPQHRFSLEKAIHDAAGFHPARFEGLPEETYQKAVEALAGSLMHQHS